MALFLAFFYGSPRARAQTVVTDTDSGLKYIDDGDGRLYIWVGGSALPGLSEIDGVSSHKYFIPDDNLRPGLRQAFNGNENKFYKTALDAVTEIGGTDASLRNQATSYKGLEYFRNLTTLKVKSENTTSGVVLDLSKNTKLTSLSYTNATRIKLSYLDISNTKLTSITIPSGGGKLSHYIQV